MRSFPRATLPFLGLCLIFILSFQAQAESIHWQSWHEDTFAQAKQENKLILLDVGTEWCAACNQMQHETYENSEVQALLKEHFVAVHVDAEAEPDIGERYGFWGWPALIFIKPNGDHVGFYRGFRPAENFTAILDHLNSSFHSGELKKQNVAVELVSKPSADDFAEIVDLSNLMIDRFYDESNGSWGGARMADPYLLKQAWWRGLSADAAQWTDRAHQTSELYLKLQDPVWGGVWFGSRSATFEDLFVYEKRTDHQAGAINIFAQAYQHDKNPKWLEAIDNTYKYLIDFMGNEQDGFATSQEMHIYTEGVAITPKAYFNLGDAKRRALGIPIVDETQYTDINAKLAIAFAQVYEATGEQKWRDRALALNAYLHTSAMQDNRYKQIIKSGVNSRARELPTNNNSVVFLRSQSFAGLANLVAFQISGDSQWLEQAHGVAEAMIDDLYDEQTGGLYGSSRQSIGPDGKPLNDQPLIDTASAADFLNRLSAYSYGAYDDIGQYDSKQYHKYAERVLRAVASPERLRTQGNFIGQYVLAIHQWNDEFTQVSVVCKDPQSAACSNLHQTALVELAHPRRIVKLQEPGFYPERHDASLFICNTSACSSPIAYDDEQLARKANKWFGALEAKQLGG